jgi:hypothetical protein
VSIFSSSSAQSIANRVQGDKAAARPADKAKAARPNAGPGRGEDELDLSVENTMTAGAVRNLKGNGDEETHDDRQQQDHYQAPHAEDAKPRPRLDIQG